MKIRNGFVSNSSSSSFIVVTPEMRAKMEEEQKRFIEKKVVRDQVCPYCKSHNIEGSPANEQKGSHPYFYQYVKCKDCGKTWNDIFRFAETELLDEDYDDYP